MGILDFFRRGKQVEAPKAEAPAPVPAVEQGIPGDANFGGRLVVEPNEALRDQSGYGRAGTYDFGEWDEIGRSNPFVAAGLDFVLGPIRDARVDVEEPSADFVPDEGLRTAVTDFVRWNLTEKIELAQFAAGAAQGFLGAGFAIFEPVFIVAQHAQIPGGSGFALARLAERLPNSLHSTPWIEENGRLVAVRQNGPRGNTWVDITLPVQNLLIFSWQRRGNNWQGRSAFRAVWYIAGRVMPELLRLIGVTLQREGAGIPIASAADASTPLTPQQRDDLVDLLSGMVFHEGASAVLPAGWKIDWIFSGGANKGHVLEAWRQLGIVVLQQVGAQQLALGTSDTGSRSVGETHDARAMAYVRSVGGFLESVLNGTGDHPSPGIVQRLVQANWGALPAYPKVKLTFKRPQLDPKTRMEAIGLAKSAGLITVTAGDENQVREELGLEPIDEGEREELKAAQPAPPTAPAPGKAPAETEDPEEAKTLEASAPRPGEWKPWRPLRASEQKLKLSEMDKYFTARRDEFEKRVRPAVVAALAKAAPSIKAAMADGDPSEVASLPLNLTRIEGIVRAFIEETRKAGASFAREEIRGDLTLTAAEDPKDKASADEVVTAQVKSLTRRIQDRLRGEIEREAIDVIQRGGDEEDVVARVVDRQLESGAFRSDAGQVTTRSFNLGREEAAKAMGGVDKVERTAILDKDTCDACRSRDGQTAEFESSEHDNLMTPEPNCSGGDNCRCLLVYLREGA